jgi:alpha-mannosidase
VAAIETQWTVNRGPAGVVHGRTVVSVEAGAVAAKVRIEFDNGAVDHRLRIRLPGVATAGLDVGAPLGTEFRGAGRSDRSWKNEAVLPTAPARRFLQSAGSAPPFRVEWPGFFEYELGSDGDVALTLCRSVGQLSRNDNRNRLGHAGWVIATPAAQEPGRHVVEFSIAPARGDTGSSGVDSIWIRAAHLGGKVVQAPSPSIR